MCPLPIDCIEQMYAEEESLKNTTGHMLFEKKKNSIIVHYLEN